MFYKEFNEEGQKNNPVILPCKSIQILDARVNALQMVEILVNESSVDNEVIYQIFELHSNLQ